jgi:tRNA(Ile)-lysidine synthase
MSPLARDVARPLLGISRDETEAYCAARGWQAREDASNADTRFARNRVRRELLPALERFNPNVRETLARNAALIAEDERYLEGQTDAAWPGVARASRHVFADTVELDLAALRAQPLALRHRLARRAANHLAGSEHGEHGLEARHVALIDGLLDRDTTGTALDLPGGLRVRRRYDALTFERGDQQAPRDRTRRGAEEVRADVDSLRLPVPGAVEMPEVGWRVRAWFSRTAPGLEAGYGPSGESGETAPQTELLPALEGVGNNADVGRAEQRAYLDADVAGDALYVRTWRPGDRFRPLGMAREKKLQDFFADAKVPRALRHRLPLVWNDRHLLWVAGQRIDDRVRLAPETRRVLVLELEPLAGGEHVGGQRTRT